MIERGAGRLAVVLRMRSMARYLRGDLAASRRWLDASDAAADELPKDHPVVAGNAARRGILLHAIGDRVAAESALRRSIGLQEGFLPPSHADRVAPLAELAVLLARSGRREEALALARRAAEIAAEQLPPESFEGSWARAALGIVVTSGDAGEPEARRLIEEAVASLELWVPANHPRLLWARAAAAAAAAPAVRSR